MPIRLRALKKANLHHEDTKARRKRAKKACRRGASSRFRVFVVKLVALDSSEGHASG
jgi:hypothetical protein